MGEIRRLTGGTMQRPRVLHSFQAKKNAELSKSVLKVHAVMTKFASRSPRMIAIQAGPRDMLEMQYQILQERV